MSTQRRRAASRSLRRLSAGLALALAATALAARDGPRDLSYRDRGDRHEGTLDWRESAGEKLTLLSARIYDPGERVREWPDRLRLAFYLPPPDGVHFQQPEISITVQELEPGTTFYRLDQVRPPAPWRFGELNAYAWPTGDVLRWLPEVTVDELAAVVRLQREDPVLERVAPSFLDHPRGARRASRYRFSFKTSVEARFECRIERRGELVFSYPGVLRNAGDKLIVRWRSSGQPEDWYRLVVEGDPALGGAGFSKEVLFYHRPMLQQAPAKAPLGTRWVENPRPGAVPRTVGGEGALP